MERPLGSPEPVVGALQSIEAYGYAADTIVHEHGRVLRAQQIAVGDNAKRKLVALDALEYRIELGMTEGFAACDNEEQFFGFLVLAAQIVDESDPLIGGQFVFPWFLAAIAAAMPAGEIAFLSYLQK